ncbi:MAG: Tol-Pal system protein TolB [Pseudomonadota bacterium]
MLKFLKKSVLKKGLVLSQILLCFIPLAVEAKTLMNIVVDGGQFGGLPIAVVPFSSDDRTHQEIATVIHQDLQNSGQFRVTPMGRINQFPDQISAVDYGYWKNVGAESLVLGRLQKQGQDDYTVYFELLDVFKGKTDARQLPLLSMRFDHIHPSQFRALAHHVADLVFEKLIGVKGIFSTRIAYISVERENTVGFGQEERFARSTKKRHAIKTKHTLQIADADGANPKILYRSDYPLMSPAWSPDGKQLAFVSFEHNRSQVSIVDVITGKVVRLTAFPGINGAPAWSPDGRQLAVVLSKEGTPKIYVLDIATKKLSMMTDGIGIDTEPYWDPKGHSIVFTSNRGGRPQIYRVDVSSKKVSRLTFNGVYNARPSITADGKKLIMMHQATPGGAFGIAVQNLETNALKVLTKATLDDSPSVAPNGMMVLYGSQRAGRQILGAVSLDGKVKLQLPAQEGDVQEPAWSPFVL